MPQADTPQRDGRRGRVVFTAYPRLGVTKLLGEDVEPHLDLGAVGAGHVALRGRDPRGLARGRLLPAMGEIDRDGEDVAGALEGDVFHCDCPFVRCVSSLRFS